MKVSKEWLNDFTAVMNHHGLDAWEIDDCKAEAREHEAWAKAFYPMAAASIRASAAIAGMSR